jgi:hypothetical protein
MTAAFRRHCSIHHPVTGLGLSPSLHQVTARHNKMAVARNPCAVTLSIASALLAACGGSQPPISPPGAMPQSSARAMQPVRSGSWMLRKATTEAAPDYKTAGPLAYVTNYTDR